MSQMDGLSLVFTRDFSPNIQPDFNYWSALAGYSAVRFEIARGKQAIGNVPRNALVIPSSGRKVQTRGPEQHQVAGAIQPDN